MGKLAKIENGAVVNVIKGDIFPGHISCPDEVSKGWLYDGSTFTAPVRPPQPVPTQEEIDAAEQAEIDGAMKQLDMARSVNKVLLKIGFLQENRIRALEGDTPVTASAFRTWVRNQID